MKYEISIITINYNNYDGLRKTIDSVENQTVKDYEWIIIDGGSSDGSKELIQEHSSSFSYWVSEPDKGIYNAMNKGISHLRYDGYVIFLNSGDYFVNSNVLSEFIKNDPQEDIVYGYVERIIDGKQQQLTGFLHKSNISLTDLYFQTIPHQGTFFKTSIFKRYGLYDESLKILSDRKIYVTSIIYGNASVRFIPISIAYFDEGGISTSSIYQKEREMVLNELFPPRVYKDMMLAYSVKEIRHSILFSKLYSILYRASMFFRKRVK